MIKDDGLLAVFLTEPSFETWRKHSSVSVEEESASKRIDRIEEMAIPSDLDFIGLGKTLNHPDLGLPGFQVIPLVF